MGVWPDGLLDAYITMIPKTDGDATLLGQRPLSVLPIVYRIWASARMSQSGMVSLFLGRWNSLLSGIRFLRWGRCILLLWMIFLLIEIWALVAFFHAASGVHRRLSDFIHRVVVHRRDEAIRE